MTIQKIIDLISEHTPPKLGPDTVDTLIAGDAAQPALGMIVTFMATRAVLKTAVALGANLIITHEPTFYNNIDQTDWLEADEVFRSKRRWIEENHLAIWRFHDGPHRFKMDAIVAGIARKLGWNSDPIPERQRIFTINPLSARDLAEWCKQHLGISQVRVAGDLNTLCTRVGLLVGATGGRRQIEMFRDDNVDVVLCGESPEWETCEYVRDAAAAGRARALIVLGHANSEEAGMEWVATWLRPIVPAAVPIHYVQAGDPFRFV